MLPILYRDEALIAVHKPAGLLVHRSHIDAQEQRFALQMLRDQPQTIGEMGAISGVGAAKLARYGEDFLGVLRA